MERSSNVLTGLEIIAIIFVLIFGLSGAIILSIITHEYSHAQDFEEVALDSEICGLVLPKNTQELINGEGGYFKFSYADDPVSNEYVERKGKFTEYKAYSISFLTLILFFASISLLMKRFALEIYKRKVIQSEAVRSQTTHIGSIPQLS